MKIIVQKAQPTATENIESPAKLTLESTAEISDLPKNYLSLPSISIVFPVFTDGRGYSLARILRENGYTGELWAIGDVLVDQLYYLKRCGFDCLQLRADQSLEAAKNALEAFTQPYQMAADGHSPITAYYNKAYYNKDSYTM